MVGKKSKAIVDFKDRSFGNVLFLFFFLVIDVIVPCTIIFVFYLSNVIEGLSFEGPTIGGYERKLIQWVFILLMLGYLVLEARHFPVQKKGIVKLILTRVLVIAMLFLFANDFEREFIHYVFFETAVVISMIMVIFVQSLVLLFKRVGETVRAFLFVFSIVIIYAFLLTGLGIIGEGLNTYTHGMGNVYAVLGYTFLWLFFLGSTVYIKWRLFFKPVRVLL